MLEVLVGVAVVVGIVGTLIPVLPGLWLVWVACLFYGLAGGFSAFGWSAMTLITVVAVVATAGGIRLAQRPAAEGGISFLWQALAVVLAVVGFFVIPVVGAAVGFIAGIVAGALVQTRDLRGAVRLSIAILRGMLVGAGVQFVAAIAMAVVWGAWVFLG